MRQYLAEGLERAGIQLSPETLDNELLFVRELLHWNRKINLTAITKENEAIEKHLIDSLFVLTLLQEKGKILDIGSGGGLPGIPLAIADRCLDVTSVDCVGKKINFQKHIKRKLSLDNLHPVHCRVEALEEKGFAPAGFDVVITRAFSSLQSVLERAACWVKAGGLVVAMKGPEVLNEIHQIEVELCQLGYRDLSVVDYKLPYSVAERHIVLVRK